jgi:hypothetical protein
MKLRYLFLVLSLILNASAFADHDRECISIYTKDKKIYGVNANGDRIIPVDWSADTYQASCKLVAFTYNGYAYAFNSNGDSLIPKDWKADKYYVSRNIVAFNLGDYVYAFNESGTSLIPKDWKGTGIKVTDDTV